MFCCDSISDYLIINYYNNPWDDPNIDHTKARNMVGYSYFFIIIQQEESDLFNLHFDEGEIYC